MMPMSMCLYIIYKYINSTDLILIEKSMFYNCACVNVSMGQHIYMVVCVKMSMNLSVYQICQYV